MSESVKPELSQNKSAPARLYGWLDRRTGIGSLMHTSLDEPIPGGARLAYVFGSGLIFIFISQVITGLCLALYYVPSAETAHTSVAYITKQVAAGAFLRSLHYYGSSAMIVVLLLHFLQTFLYGSFKGRRELLWASGALLSFLVLAMGFTGYLLPWDQKAYFATAVGTNIVGEVPLVGEWLTRLLRGGDTLGTLTLSRFYVAHLFLIPGAIFLFIAVHIALFRKAGPAGPINEDPVHPKLAPEGFYPRQVIMDMAFALLLMIGLGILAFFHPVELGPVANPADTQFLPRPEWYYLSMFEWLKFWQGSMVVFAIVVIPGILALMFFLMPFLDRSLERRPWRRPIPLLGVSIVLLGMVYLGMKSHRDDESDPTTAAQIARQDAQEEAYSKAPFEPYVASPGGSAGTGAAASGPANPVVSQGKGVFSANGCSGCHGETGMGTAAAPSLVGVTSKYPVEQLTEWLHNPNPKMRAGNMPAVDLSPSDMSALLSYLGVLGTSAANVPATYNAEQPKLASSNKEAPAAGKTVEAPALSVKAIAGQQFFQSHACFACHGQAGAGTARVAPMAGLIAKQSDAQLAQLLHNPSAKMRAGGMAALEATPDQINSVVAYLRSLAPVPTGPSQQVVMAPAAETPVEQTANAAAPSPSAAAVPAVPVAGFHAVGANAQPLPGRAVFVANGCAACHGTVGQGTHFAPALIGIDKKFSPAQLSGLIHHPTKKMRDGGMPSITVTDTEMQQLVAYLTSLGATTAPQQVVTSQGAGAAPVANQAASAPVSASQVAAMTRAATEELKALPLSPEATLGKAVFQKYSCETCHGVGGLHGTVAAPGLAGTASILPATMLENLLRHHSKKMQQGGMPLTNMNAQDMKEIVAYIRSMPMPKGGQ